MWARGSYLSGIIYFVLNKGGRASGHHNLSRVFFGFVVQINSGAHSRVATLIQPSFQKKHYIWLSSHLAVRFFFFLPRVLVTRYTVEGFVCQVILLLFLTFMGVAEWGEWVQKVRKKCESSPLQSHQFMFYFFLFAPTTVFRCGRHCTVLSGLRCSADLKQKKKKHSGVHPRVSTLHTE